MAEHTSPGAFAAGFDRLTSEAEPGMRLTTIAA